MDFSEKDYPYYFVLVLLGAAIGYISSLNGGLALLIVIGIVIELIIGYRSNNWQSAAVVGALFAVVTITANSPIINGYTGHGDPMTTLFFPYLVHAVFAVIAGSLVALVGHTALPIHRRR